MSVNAYGMLMALSILLGAVLCTKEEKERGLPRDTGVDIILYALPPAIVGARLYYVLFALEQFRHDPVSVFYVWQGGLAIYGGVIGGVLGLFLLSRKKGQPFQRLLDVAAPNLLLGQAIGRWGNFFNQEAHGRQVVDAALQFFPVSVSISGQWYYATFFYESLWNLIGFALIYHHRKQLRVRDGETVLWYFLWYALGRSVIEMMRTDSLMLGNLRVSQGLSILLFALSAALLSNRQRTGWLRFAFCLTGVCACIAGALMENMPVLLAGAAIELGYTLYLWSTYKTRDHAANDL